MVPGENNSWVIRLDDSLPKTGEVCTDPYCLTSHLQIKHVHMHIIQHRYSIYSFLNQIQCLLHNTACFQLKESARNTFGKSFGLILRTRIEPVTFTYQCHSNCLIISLWHGTSDQPWSFQVLHSEAVILACVIGWWMNEVECDWWMVAWGWRGLVDDDMM